MTLFEEDRQNSDILYEDLCFDAQQAVEKSLKASSRLSKWGTASRSCRAKPSMKSYWLPRAARFAVGQCEYRIGQPATERLIVAELLKQLGVIPK